MAKKIIDYYDEFSGWYDNERFKGYHAFIDNLEYSCLEPYCTNKKVLEAGCGTGLILQRISKVTSSAYGIDISSGMLDKSIERGLNVQLGSLTEIPFDDDTFDTVYSVKVISHIEDLKKGLFEMARVTKVGGYVIPEFYNKLSIRYIIKLIRPGKKISNTTTDKEVFTKYYTLSEFNKYIPENLTLTKLFGVRIVTVLPGLHKVKLIAIPLSWIENKLAYSPLKYFGGFIVPVYTKKK
jgi:ubiquinone/menaquinone biosynthesis C-methylase UbiE